MAIYTTELLTDRDYNIPEGRLPLEYAVDTANKAKTHSEDAEVHVTAADREAWNDIAAVKNAASFSLGSGSSVSNENNIAIGLNASAAGNGSIVIGANAYCYEHVDIEVDGNVVIGVNSYCDKWAGVAIGQGAQVKSMYGTAIGAHTETSNHAVAIGYAARAKTSYGIAIGNCTVTGNHSIGIGGNTNTDYGITIGGRSRAKYGTGIGPAAYADAQYTVCLGHNTQATASHSTALGEGAKVKDIGAVVIAAWSDDATTQTLLYLIGAGSTLATTYEGGEACLGYVTKTTAGEILTAGTRKLSELLTNNTTFAPASLDPEAAPPTVFLPTGATDPIEDPKLPTETEQESPLDQQQ